MMIILAIVVAASSWMPTSASEAKCTLCFRGAQYSAAPEYIAAADGTTCADAGYALNPTEPTSSPTALPTVRGTVGASVRASLRTSVWDIPMAADGGDGVGRALLPARTLRADDPECRAGQADMFSRCGCPVLPPVSDNPTCSVCFDGAAMRLPGTAAVSRVGPETFREVTCEALDNYLGHVGASVDCAPFQEADGVNCGCPGSADGWGPLYESPKMMEKTVQCADGKTVGYDSVATINAVASSLDNIRHTFVLCPGKRLEGIVLELRSGMIVQCGDDGESSNECGILRSHGGLTVRSGKGNAKLLGFTFQYTSGATVSFPEEWVDGQTVHFIDCHWIDNRLVFDGFDILSVTVETAVFDRCTFQKNSPSLSVVTVKPWANVEMRGCLFEENDTPQRVITVEDKGSLTITDCCFVNNYSPGYGSIAAGPDATIRYDAAENFSTGNAGNECADTVAEFQTDGIAFCYHFGAGECPAVDTHVKQTMTIAHPSARPTLTPRPSPRPSPAPGCPLCHGGTAHTAGPDARSFCDGASASAAAAFAPPDPECAAFQAQMQSQCGCPEAPPPPVGAPQCGICVVDPDAEVALDWGFPAFRAHTCGSLAAFLGHHPRPETTAPFLNCTGYQELADTYCGCGPTSLPSSSSPMITPTTQLEASSKEALNSSSSSIRMSKRAGWAVSAIIILMILI